MRMLARTRGLRPAPLAATTASLVVAVAAVSGWTTLTGGWSTSADAATSGNGGLEQSTVHPWTRIGPHQPALSVTGSPAHSGRRALALRTTPKVTKLLTFVTENHSRSQMQAQMPYADSLAKRYGYATHYTAVTHPSLPNYLAIAGGSTFGVGDDSAPSAHPVAARSVFGQALAAGRTARVYADGMPSGCARTDGGSSYAVKHNPWAYFTPARERSGCLASDVPESRLRHDVTAGRLPNVGLVVPNLCHDAHNCELSTADAWFRSRMHTIMAGPDWRSGRLAVVLTADEDDHRSGNTVLTVVVHPSQHHHVVSTALTHYSLTRLYEQVIGTTDYLRNAASAPDMAAAFGLPVG